MTRGDEERVHDILEACHKPAEIAAMGRAEYDRSWMLRSAAERQLEIIGQAASHLSVEVVAANPDLPIEQAKGLCNVIVDEYSRVIHDRVKWPVVSDGSGRFAHLSLRYPVPSHVQSQLS